VQPPEAGNAGDASVAADLIADLADDNQAADHEASDHEASEEKARVYGDNAYGSGVFQQFLEQEGIESRPKTQNPVATNGLFAKDRFLIDLDHDAVTCPAGVTVEIRRHADRSGTAAFADHCAGCRLREQCTTAVGGRTVSVGVHEDVLSRARARQTDPTSMEDYRTTRPKVERKLAHLVRRRHGGRRARMRGRERVRQDFSCTYSVNPGPPGLLRSQGSERCGACRAVSSGAALR